MVKRNILMVFLLLTILSAPACALDPDGGIKVNSINITHLVPMKIPVDFKTWITIQFDNTGFSLKDIAYQEWVSGNADFDYTQAKEEKIVYKGEGHYNFIAGNYNLDPSAEYVVTRNSFIWNFTLKPGEQKRVAYWIGPKYVGEYHIPPASITIDGTKYELPGKTIKISCTQGHACNPVIGENYLTCPQNCKTGAADNICNPIKDGQYDPDCVTGMDPDYGIKISSLAIGIFLMVIMLIGCAWYFLKKKKEN